MNEVINKINSAEDRSWLFEFLDKLEREIFNPSIIPSQFLDSNSRNRFTGSLKDYFFTGDFEPEKILSKIKELRNELRALPTVTLTVAKFPDNEQIEAVKSYFTDQDKPVLIEFAEDKNLIGGAVIESNGWILEHSFRDYFEKRQHTVLEKTEDRFERFKDFGEEDKR